MTSVITALFQGIFEINISRIQLLSWPILLMCFNVVEEVTISRHQSTEPLEEGTELHVELLSNRTVYNVQ